MSNKQVSNSRHYWEHTREQDRWMNYVLLRVIRNVFLGASGYGCVDIWSSEMGNHRGGAEDRRIAPSKRAFFSENSYNDFGDIFQPDDDEDDEIDLLRRQNIKSMTGTSNAFSSQPPRFRKNMTVHPTPSSPRLAFQAGRADRHLKYSEFDALKWG